jgi:hypothetical protein
LGQKRERETDFRDTVVTLLIENSGSMRGRPITGIAFCCARTARAAIMAVAASSNSRRLIRDLNGLEQQSCECARGRALRVIGPLRSRPSFRSPR